MLKFLTVNPLGSIRITTHKVKKHQDPWNFGHLLIDQKFYTDILGVPRQSLERLTRINLKPRPSIPLVQLRKHTGLNKDRGERIPKNLINVPDSVEVIRANGPVFTLGQEFIVTDVFPSKIAGSRIPGVLAPAAGSVAGEKG
jgi:hypothetical protein